VIAYTVLFRSRQSIPATPMSPSCLEMAGAGSGRAGNRPGGSAGSERAVAAPPAGQLGHSLTLLKEAEQTLNTDRRLAESFARAATRADDLVRTGRTAR